MKGTKKMPKALKLTGRIIGIVLTVIVGLVLVCNIYLIAAENVFGVEQPTVFGFSVKIIGSPSMQPTINVDDMIVVKACDEYVVGDVIMFDDPNLSAPVTHRIIAENTDGTFVTKGDNPQNSPDPNPVSPDEIYGKVVKTFSGVGRVVEFARSPLGMILLFGIAALLIFISPSKSDDEKSEKEKSENGEEDSRENDAKAKEIEALRAELEALKAEKTATSTDTPETAAPAETPEAPAEAPAEPAENEISAAPETAEDPTDNIE